MNMEKSHGYRTPTIEYLNHFNFSSIQSAVQIKNVAKVETLNDVNVFVIVFKKT